MSQHTNTYEWDLKQAGVFETVTGHEAIFIETVFEAMESGRPVNEALFLDITAQLDKLNGRPITLNWKRDGEIYQSVEVEWQEG